MCKRYINWFPLEHPQLGTWPTTQACALTGNRTSDPLVCRLALNPLSHTSQGRIYGFKGHFHTVYLPFLPNIYKAGAVTLSFQKHNLGLCMKGVAYESGGGGVGTQLSDPTVAGPPLAGL